MYIAHLFSGQLVFLCRLCTSHLKPPHPPIRAWAGHSLFMQVKVSEVPGCWGQKWVVHSPTLTFKHMVFPLSNNLLLPSVTHWLKGTVGSHEENRLIFEWPANNLQKQLTIFVFCFLFVSFQFFSFSFYQ